MQDKDTRPTLTPSALFWYTYIKHQTKDASMFTFSEWLSDLFKAAGHKYIKRVPYMSGGKRRYRYIYKLTHMVGGKHVLDPEHMVVGAAFQMETGAGKEVHAHIVSTSGENVTYKLDDGPDKGKVFTVTRAQLAQKLDEKHGARAALATERDKQAKVVADLKAASASSKQVAREQARLDRLEAALPAPAHGKTLTDAVEAHARGRVSADDLQARSRDVVDNVLVGMPQGELREALQARMLDALSGDGMEQLIRGVLDAVEGSLAAVDAKFLGRLGQSSVRETADDNVGVTTAVPSPSMNDMARRMVHRLQDDAEKVALPDATVSQRAQDSVDTIVAAYTSGLREGRDKLLAHQQALRVYTPAELNKVVARLRDFAETETASLLRAAKEERSRHRNDRDALRMDRILENIGNLRDQLAARFERLDATSPQRDIAHREMSKYIAERLQQIQSEIARPIADVRQEAAMHLGEVVRQAKFNAFRRRVLRDNLNAYADHLREIEEG